MAEIPIWIHQLMQQSEKTESAAIKNKSSAAPQPSPGEGETAPNQEQNATSKSQPSMSFGAALGQLALLGLASPFLELQDPVHGVIGLIILLVGLRIAWKMTHDDGQQMQIDGPYGNTSAVSA
jgi:hypothetical protein